MHFLHVSGMQHGVLRAESPNSLPLRFKLLPEYLGDLNYSSAAVGKWHLGHARRNFWPTRRGFQSAVGYLLGKQDYYDHTNDCSVVKSATRKEVENFFFSLLQQGWGYDFRRGLNVSWEDYGTYATDIFTDEAIKIINSHGNTDQDLEVNFLKANDETPLFLYLAHLAVHSANTYSPLQVRMLF